MDSRIGADLDLRDGFDRDGDALLGVEVLLRRDVEGHQLERELLAALDHGEDDRARSLDDARAAKAIDDDGLVGSSLAKHLRNAGHDDEKNDNSQSDEDSDNVRHNDPYR